MSGVQILFADDSQTNLYVMAKMLEMGKFSFELAIDGREAVDKALRDKPDVVLLDINMPGVDGVAAAREIRRRAKDACPVLVAVTAADTLQQREECERAEFDHFLPKPLRLEKLLPFLSELITPQVTALD